MRGGGVEHQPRRGDPLRFDESADRQHEGLDIWFHGSVAPLWKNLALFRLRKERLPKCAQLALDGKWDIAPLWPSPENEVEARHEGFLHEDEPVSGGTKQLPLIKETPCCVNTFQ